jgi:xanthine dehydrogenase accessory factor
MAFDLTDLSDAVDRHGAVVRVVIAGTKGSAPRGAGTSMLVWTDDQSGTIGGGTLEFQAVAAARDLLGQSGDWQRTRRAVPLGPALGQCCGGSVTLLSEKFSALEVSELQSLAGKCLDFIRLFQSGIGPQHRQYSPRDSFSEPFERPLPAIWIFGAGHVGRALVHVLPSLGYNVTWIDTEPSRFPDLMPSSVTQLVSQNPAEVVRYAPHDARHLVLTYSHALDLEICHQILSHSFQFAGLIGSATKWARFQKRLAALGHSQAQIARITCPIGQPELGKSPQAIAVGVAAALLKEAAASESQALQTMPPAKEHAI